MTGRKHLTAQTWIFQVKVELRDVRPSVWRRVLVPDAMTLAELDEVVGQVMGRPEGHRHEFEVEAQGFGIPDPDGDDGDLLDSTLATLGLVAGEGSELLHLQLCPDEIGESWSHVLTVERVSAPEPGARYPRCVAGARSCPPEEAGGPYQFRSTDADKRLEPFAWLNSA